MKKLKNIKNVIARALSKFLIMYFSYVIFIGLSMTLLNIPKETSKNGCCKFVDNTILNLDKNLLYITFLYY